MDRKDNQNYKEAVRLSSSEDAIRLPPPLPVRPSRIQPFNVPSPHYTELPQAFDSQLLASLSTAQDPRSSSTQSLRSEISISNADKRRLLLIYIHGFMGDETAFQSFPAHVHNIVKEKLHESHTLHTKIYPKYKTRKKVDFVKEDFSNWLGPHESPDTDVILLGHSMGGILAAEVTLMPSVTDDTRKLRHRVIGTINFDTPFLGIHPGVVASGLGSLFRPAPGSPKPEPATTNLAQQPASFNQQAQPGEDSFIPNSDGSSTTLPVPQSTTPLTSPPLSPYLCTPIDDPNYDPPFPNDNLLTPRLGWSNALHFINKHSDGLVRATKTYVTSHLEFGFALVDHKTLKPRYRTIRKLEDGTKVGRVRFVNYYTACTGRPKKSKDDKEQTQPERIVGELDACVENANLEDANERSRSTTPRVSVDVGSVDHRTLTEEKQPVANINTASNVSDLVESIGQNAPIPCNVENAEDRPLQNKDASQGEESLANSSGQSLASYLMDNGLSLPPIPASPPEPPRFTCESNDKELRRIAEQQYKRDVKAYRRAQKDRHKAVSDRRKYLEKREKEDVKRDKKERLKAGKNETKEKAAMTDEESSRKDAGASPTPTTSTASSETGHDQGRKPPRDKRFCLLPSKVNGLPDPCWERVFMPDVDEVGAHCGLFFMDGDRYEWFVGDVSQRIVDWVREA